MPTTKPKSPTPKTVKPPAPRTAKSPATLGDLDSVRNMLVGNDIKLAEAIDNNAIVNNRLEGEFRASIQNHGAGIKRAHDGLAQLAARNEAFDRGFRRVSERVEIGVNRRLELQEDVERLSCRGRSQRFWLWVAFLWLLFLTMLVSCPLVGGSAGPAPARVHDGVRHVQPPAPADAGHMVTKR